MIRALTSTVIATLFVALPVLAQDGQGAQEGQGGGRGHLRQACGADFQQFCQGVQAGGGARIKCLQDHSDKLSEGCKTALSAVQARGAGQGGGESKNPPASDDQK